MCHAKGYVLLAVLVWNRVSISTILIWSEIGYGLCTLVLNWVCFLEELATSSSFGDKTISLLLFTPTTVYVPYNSLSRAPVTRRASGLQVWNRVSNFGSGPK